MPVTVRLSGPPLAETAFSDAGLMRQIGLEVRERIVTRTQAGQDRDGNAFRPYSASYAMQKAKALGGGDKPDLTVSGAMLQSLVLVEVTDKSVTVGYRD